MDKEPDRMMNTKEMIEQIREFERLYKQAQFERLVKMGIIKPDPIETHEFF